MIRPKIAVTGPSRGGLGPWLFISNLLRLYGAKPVRVTPQHPKNLKGLCGLVVSGGQDVDPKLYGGVKELADVAKSNKGARYWRWGRFFLGAGVYALRRLTGLKRGPSREPERDRLEKELIDQALNQKLPLLGICRGMQLINVVKGGDLNHDVADFYEEVSHPYTVLPRKHVHLEVPSRLSEIMEGDDFWVNALHHQSVKRTGKGLKVVARDDAGVVQAIEQPDCPFLFGLQWHPEFMPQLPAQRRLFHRLVQAARQV